MISTIPQLGLGTWKLHGEQLISSLRSAFSLGYRHLDTAWIYHNEQAIWSFLSQSSIPRSELRITTKVRFDGLLTHQKAPFKLSDFSYTQLETRFHQTLQDLKTDYLDLVLLHRPSTPDNDAQAFETLLRLKKAGKIRQVGVSNFSFSQLELLYSRFGSEIFTNQIEWHVCLSSLELETFAKEKKLILTAYSPLAQGHLLSYAPFLALAEEFQLPPAQLALAYLLTKGAVVIPKASSQERLQENFEAQKLVLAPEIIARLDQLPKHHRYCNPPFAR